MPGLRGFSVTNLRNMRIFYEEWKMLEEGESSVLTDELENNSIVLETGLTTKNEICSLQRINSIGGIFAYS